MDVVRSKLFSAALLSLFMAASFAMAACYLPETLSKTENPTLKSILKGTWTPEFEKNLNESLPVFNPSRNFWGRLEYSWFGEGRKGVIVGSNGWLFTEEEFSCIPHGDQNTQDNLDYIANVADILKEKGIKLHVILVPAKARVYKEYTGKHNVPHCRANLYNHIINSLTEKHIPVVELLTAFRESPQRDTLYLKTDTHWTTQGARMAAMLAAGQIETDDLKTTSYTTHQTKSNKHEGDLLRYIPGVRNNMIKPDDLMGYETQKDTNASSGEQDAASALFGEDVPPVTLVGTSYSANPKWHFEGFLKDSLDVEILNMADVGQGPFTVMKKYLDGDTIKNTPPSLVIWEIPERYVPTRTGFLYDKDPS